MLNRFWFVPMLNSGKLNFRFFQQLCRFCPFDNANITQRKTLPLLSSKRIEAFLDEIFADEENIKTSRFLTKFNLLQNCVIDNIVDGKFKPMAETLVPQFTVEVGAADGITDTAGVEPDATKKGAFFFVGIVSFRFGDK